MSDPRAIRPNESRLATCVGGEPAPVVAMPQRPASLMPSITELDAMLRIGEQFAASGLMPDSVKTAAAVVVIMQKGRELGIPPMQAINGIHVIKGKPTCSSDLMMALIFRDHGDDALRWVETTNESVTLAYKRRSWADPATFTWSKADTDRAQIRNENNQKYPGAMLRARCVSAVARMAFNDTIGGMYLPSEIDPAYDDDGVRRFTAGPSTDATAIEASGRASTPDPGIGPEPTMTDRDEHQQALRTLFWQAGQVGIESDDVKRFIADLKRIPLDAVPSRKDWSLPFIGWATKKLEQRGAEWVADRQRAEQLDAHDDVIEGEIVTDAADPDIDIDPETGEVIPATFPQSQIFDLSDPDRYTR